MFEVEGDFQSSDDRIILDGGLIDSHCDVPYSSTIRSPVIARVRLCGVLPSLLALPLLLLLLPP